MDNKIFISQLKKMFPETKQPNQPKKSSQLEYHDELDLVEPNDTSHQMESSFSVNQHQISAI